MNRPHSLDALDMRILRVLSEDGRMSWRDLADTVGLSLTPTLRRVRRLEADEFIKGYAARLCERKLGGKLNVFISVTLERQNDESLSVFETAIAALPEVASCYQMTGQTDYLLRVVVRDLDHYQRLLSQCTRIPGVAHIQSSFTLKTIVRRPPVAL